MDRSLLAVLNDAERLLVAEAEPAALVALDEEAAIDLEARIRRQMVPRQRREGPSVTPEPKGDRSLRSPLGDKERAAARASGARWQAARERGSA